MSKCFVVMGYGERPDPDTFKIYDLDKSYRSVIEEGVRRAGFEPVRADHIVESGMISRQMYRDLMDADLVVCDLTTLNPNALYELGVRMAMRPRATVVIAAEGTKVPFNLNQNRFFWYKHGGKVIDYEDAKAAQQKLFDVCSATMQTNEPDSLIYSILGQELEPPRWRQPEKPIARPPMTHLAGGTSFLAAASEPPGASANAARQFVFQAKRAKRWNDIVNRMAQLHEEAHRQGHPIESWFTQQWALATYKRQETLQSSDLEDLLAARQILDRLDPVNSTDPETLGLWAAVCRRLADHPGRIPDFQSADLRSAIAAYRKGYILRRDHYNGANYAFLLLRRAVVMPAADHRRNVRDIVEATDAWQHVIELCRPVLNQTLPDGTGLALEQREQLDEDFWRTASLAQSFLALGDDGYRSARNHLEKLQGLLGQDWMLVTTDKQENVLKDMLLHDNYTTLAEGRRATDAMVSA